MLGFNSVAATAKKKLAVLPKKKGIKTARRELSLSLKSYDVSYPMGIQRNYCNFRYHVLVFAT